MVWPPRVVRMLSKGKANFLLLTISPNGVCLVNLIPIYLNPEPPQVVHPSISNETSIRTDTACIDRDTSAFLTVLQFQPNQAF